MFYPSAKIIADSVNGNGDRLTTFELTYHRYIHSEVMTYRNLSRSSASSRAIPVEKMIKLVKEQEVTPLHWGRNCKGMSAKEELNQDEFLAAWHIWKTARENAVASAESMARIPVHKQIINRLLEPFATITVIATGTSWGNLFEQRCHKDSQPEFKALADLMKDAYDENPPCEAKAGEWHVPFLDRENIDHPELLKIATGRCARVSYLNHDGDRSINDDIKLHDRLLSSKPAHLSPFEHCAIALSNSGRHANLTGWQSYRNILEQKSNSL